MVCWPSYRELCHSVLWQDDLSSNGIPQNGHFPGLRSINSVNDDGPAPVHMIKFPPALLTNVVIIFFLLFSHLPSYLAAEGRQVPASCSCSPRMSIGKVTWVQQAKSTVQAPQGHLSPPAEVYLISADNVVVSR